MSLVKLQKIEQSPHKLSLHLLGADLVDQTPVLDIKPYLPYADSVPHAQAAYANHAPEIILTVHFSDIAQQQCQQHKSAKNGDLQTLITQILQYDPRPAYKRTQSNDTRIYAMKLYNFDLRWHYLEEGIIEVIELR